MSGPPPALIASLVNGPSLVGGLEWHDEIVSTNARAAELARDGVPEIYAVVADVQSRGRGRQGRTWTAPAGTSLLLSLVVRPSVSPPSLALLPLLAGLALAEAVEACVPAVRIGVKWPNDLLAGGRKLAGILVEALPDTAAVVGVGLNVDWSGIQRARDLAGRATSLAELSGEPVDRWGVMTAFLDVFGTRYAAWQELPGAFVRGYRARCLTVGQTVRVHPLQGATLQGVATAVGQDGTLHVRDAGGVVHRLHAGDVEHVRPAP